MKLKPPFKAKFVTTAVAAKNYPVLRNEGGDLLPEIALAGRSNVGKSSLLNDLFQAKRLVKTSSTPGKTQTINFFTLNDKLSFADLPGYGFANVPLTIKKQWGPMVKKYLQSRETLQLILFLFDIRRVPNEEDRQFLEWVAFNQKALILVLTKVDKVNQSEKHTNTKKILEEFGAENLHYVYYSVPKQVGRQNLLNLICDALTDEKEEPHE